MIQFQRLIPLIKKDSQTFLAAQRQNTWKKLITVIFDRQMSQTTFNLLPFIKVWFFVGFFRYKNLYTFRHHQSGQGSSVVSKLTSFVISINIEHWSCNNRRKSNTNSCVWFWGCSVHILYRLDSYASVLCFHFRM